MDKLIFSGIKTHNLKNIDVEILRNKITAIYGRSGAGKSSLAMSTIYQLCKNEFDAIENGSIDSHDYELSGYNGVIPATAISQRNANNNPRSTLYSYLNISLLLSLLKNNNTIPDFHDLKINNAKNSCLKCDGLGEIIRLENTKMIDHSRSLDDSPFYCWRNGELSDYYNQLLIAFCNNEKIDVSKKIDQLSDLEREKIFFGQSDKKLIFRCKHKGVMKQRRAFYIGVMIYSQKNIKMKSSTPFTSNEICDECNGSRINERTSNLNVLNISFKSFLVTPISKLIQEEIIIDQGEQLYKILSSMVKMGLGYLNLSRSIPSLSGGELQKTLFSKLLTSNINGIILVLDEISSQVNELEHDRLIEYIKYLSLNNTILLVEHNYKFIEMADIKLHIGSHAGERGGYICQDELILPFKNNNKRNKIIDLELIESLSCNNVINQSVNIPLGCVTLFRGQSGSGKSSLAKAICKQQESIYISQKIPSYSSRSTLSTITKLNILIAEFYAKETGRPIDNFIPTKLGACKVCLGLGVVKYERSYEKDIYITCQSCDGDLFDREVVETKIPVRGVSIIDAYSKEISYLIDIFTGTRFHSILKTMHELGLSHLAMKRRTQTLSGGELRRIRLCELLNKSRKTNKIMIIDEPTAGLDSETASKVLDLIYKKSSFFKAVILIEHKSEALNYIDYIVEVGPGYGLSGGKVIGQKSIFS
ncbi:ATP-binding cassette domain-containing protein [Candidatus Pantoea multigeneris]|uniref:UvrABC system protein A n=1 Tax=Candidatus Pantoea multigeneris TaxID=2608357 RepID=A0ABX0R7L8_9GAMM|nr:ATP-binding cassette domain-containing protein [Pantoea multigeneris]NIF20428.1 ATP-binding cassette domain-containing protein [Pantoea multigeneris]